VRLDWDDARYFLALSRHRSLRGAARSLSVSASTMARRIEALEERLTATLFDRIAGEFVLNASGDRFLETAEKVESLFFELGRDIVGSDARLEGHIKLALPADLGGDLLMPAIKAFSDNHPATTIEFASSYAFADLSRREADIAVRAQTCEVPPPEYLIGRKVGVVYHAAYRAMDVPRSEAATLPWLGWSDEGEAPKWVRDSEFPDRPARHIFSDSAAQMAAARAGLGMTIIPCFLGDADGGLKRCGRRKPWPARDIWILSHADLRETARFRALRSHLADSIKSQKATLSGIL